VTEIQITSITAMNNTLLGLGSDQKIYVYKKGEWVLAKQGVLGGFS
jgi:hypothetical protein